MVPKQPDQQNHDDMIGLIYIYIYQAHGKPSMLLWEPPSAIYDFLLSSSKGSKDTMIFVHCLRYSQPQLNLSSPNAPCHLENRPCKQMACLYTYIVDLLFVDYIMVKADNEFKHKLKDLNTYTYTSLHIQLMNHGIIGRCYTLNSSWTGKSIA